VTSPEAVAKTRFNASRPTKVIIHGFIDSGFVPWVKVNEAIPLIQNPEAVFLVMCDPSMNEL